MTEFSTVIQLGGEKHISGCQPHPRPKSRVPPSPTYAQTV